MAPHQVLPVMWGLAPGPGLRAEPPSGPLILKPGLTEASGLPGPSPRPHPLPAALSSWPPGSFLGWDIYSVSHTQL